MHTLSHLIYFLPKKIESVSNDVDYFNPTVIFFKKIIIRIIWQKKTLIINVKFLFFLKKNQHLCAS